MNKRKKNDTKGSKKLPIIMFIGSVIFLIAVQFLFNLHPHTKWLDAVWEAGDLITFVGTIALGIVAIWQTKAANEISHRMLQLEENRHKLEIRPFVIVEDWSVFEKDEFQIHTQPDQLYVSICNSQGVTAFCLALMLTNTTQSYVSVTYGGADYVDSGNPISSAFSYSNITNKALRLQSGEGKNIIFYGGKDLLIEMLNHKKIRFKFVLQNRFGERYREDFDAFLLIREIPTSPENHLMPHVIVETSNYRIGKFTGDNNTVEWEENNEQA